MPPNNPLQPRILFKENGLVPPPEVRELLLDREFCINVAKNESTFCVLIDAAVRGHITEANAAASGHVALTGKLCREYCRQFAAQGREYLSPSTTPTP